MSNFADQSQFRVRCEWGMHGIDTVARHADAIVIVDVLSFSTSVDVAIARSATVFPYRWKDDSAAHYALEQNALLAGHRRDAGATFSLSPSSLASIPAGTRLVLPSPNGSTLAFAAQQTAKHVASGCLRNASAVASWASQFDSIAVIPAGERWPDGSLRPAIEDLIGAGAIIRKLAGEHSPEARIAVAAFETAARFERILDDSASGRELIEMGFEADVEIASQHNASDCVPVLRDNAFVRRE